MSPIRKYLSNAERQKAYRQRKRLCNAIDDGALRNNLVSRPPLRWLGGKWRLAQWIIGMFPPHLCYVEPFGGAASVLLQKQPSRLEVYNDLDQEVVNFFVVLRTNLKELVQLIELTPFARDELLGAMESTKEPLERARRFYVRCWQAFQPGSGYDSTPSWRLQKDWARGKSVIDEWNTTSHLLAVATRLKHVEIENRPALEVLQRFDSARTLFYVDPPYVMDTRQMGTQTRYKYEMTDKDHLQLSQMLRSLSGMVILSGYESELYNEFYGDWHKVSKTTTTNGNGTSTEYLWLSPRTVEFNHLPLFMTLEALPQDA